MCLFVFIVFSLFTFSLKIYLNCSKPHANKCINIDRHILVIVYSIMGLVAQKYYRQN